jgi:S-disulfanyl-L-cysteine oxidoreductase SoxD
MPRSSLLFGLAAIVYGSSLGAAIVVAQAASPSAGAPSGGTVWDGAYTDAQATRAVTTFSAACAECHTLGGTGDGQLVGTPFWESYSQKTVGDLLTFVRTNMPSGAEGSLTPSTYADLVALILKSNGLPAGTTELGPASTAHLKIIPKDGSTALPANSLARVVGCLSKSGSDWVLTNTTAPERIDAAGVGKDDATRPLGEGKITLKFVLSRLDAFVGQRMSASGILIGTGGVDGLNVSSVNRVAATCP